MNVLPFDLGPLNGKSGGNPLYQLKQLMSKIRRINGDCYFLIEKGNNLFIHLFLTCSCRVLHAKCTYIHCKCLQGFARCPQVFPAISMEKGCTEESQRNPICTPQRERLCMLQGIPVIFTDCREILQLSQGFPRNL